MTDIFLQEVVDIIERKKIQAQVRELLDMYISGKNGYTFDNFLVDLDRLEKRRLSKCDR